MYLGGISQISCLGQGWQCLQKAASASEKVLPEACRVNVKTCDQEVQVSILRAVEPQLAPDVPESIRRRLPRLSKMFLTASSEAIVDTFGQSSPAEILQRPDRVGVIVGTAFGCLELANSYVRRIQLEGPAGASPTAFAGSTHNAIASQLSIAFGIQGPSCTVSTMAETFPGCLRLAWDWMDQDITDYVLLSVGDEISDYHLYTLAHHQGCLNGAMLGEGVVSFLFSREKRGRGLLIQPPKFEPKKDPLRSFESDALVGRSLIAEAFAMGLSLTKG